MASMALASTTLQTARTMIALRPWSSKVLFGIAPGPIQVAGKTKGAAGKGMDSAEELAGKAQQNAQEAWGAVIKQTVVGKAEEAKGINQGQC